MLGSALKFVGSLDSRAAEWRFWLVGLSSVGRGSHHASGRPGNLW